MVSLEFPTPLVCHCEPDLSGVAISAIAIDGLSGRVYHNGKYTQKTAGGING